MPASAADPTNATSVGSPVTTVRVAVSDYLGKELLAPVLRDTWSRSAAGEGRALRDGRAGAAKGGEASGGTAFDGRAASLRFASSKARALMPFWLYSSIAIS